jgi:hypothetical protein
MSFIPRPASPRIRLEEGSPTGPPPPAFFSQDLPNMATTGGFEATEPVVPSFAPLSRTRSVAETESRTLRTWHSMNQARCANKPAPRSLSPHTPRAAPATPQRPER